jgi:uncharacterized protein
MTDRLLGADLPDFVAIDVLARELDVEDVPADQVAAGAPRTGLWEIDEAGPALGIWEMTAGAMTDVEADEVFLVIEGTATVTATAPDGSERTLELRPGILCRLAAGTATRWDVPDRLRKLYLAA